MSWNIRGLARLRHLANYAMSVEEIPEELRGEDVNQIYRAGIVADIILEYIQTGAIKSPSRLQLLANGLPPRKLRGLFSRCNTELSGASHRCFSLDSFTGLLAEFEWLIKEDKELSDLSYAW